MKTINIKKAAFITLITIGLFNFSFIADASGINKTNTVILEETDEPEMIIEPWMSNINDFKQVTSIDNDQNNTTWFLTEEEESPIPIQGWMTDLSYNKYFQIQGKSFDSHLTNIIKYKLR